MTSLNRTIVIGGGAAGVFAAITSKEVNPEREVILLEKSNQLLSKVRISGGGRCNVTHACFEPKELIQNYPRGSKELLGPFYHFQPLDTIAWFKKQGVELKTEADGRMFPLTNSSQTIIDCLLNVAGKKGVIIHKMHRIESVKKEQELFSIDSLVANRLILATGSSTWGHEMAASFGHTIIQPVPSLFTFNVPTSPLLDLPGITLEKVILTIDNYSQKGPLLLTHWGFSGPAALKLSAFAARALYKKNYQDTLYINWIAAKNEEEVFQAVINKRFELPAKLATRLLSFSKDPRILAKKLYRDPYNIEGTTLNKQEFVTAGGVCLKEVDFKTMQSRLCPGLYFAGEILDIDGITGGFNFQNAWTTGFLAGKSTGFT
ncbi:MAG: NAD(P)/FAD-dependent oxidoreductase [Chlamydiae bacterium]|nr:NAD(P)/FAD-dependent oxidoreductase [Chlamydiota bacterium]